MEFLKQKNGFSILTKPAETKQIHDILIFNDNKYYFKQTKGEALQWRCSGSNKKCNKVLLTNKNKEKLIFQSLICYEIQVKSLKLQDVHAHPNTWTQTDKERIWTMRKLHSMTAFSNDVRKSYNEFNQCYPSIAVRAIPRFESVKRKMYIAKLNTSPKLPNSCSGIVVFTNLH